MKRETLSWGLAMGFVAIVVLLNGCATVQLPPAKPIKDIKNIAGTWKSEDGERTLFLNADGNYRSQGEGGRGSSGTFFIKGGKMVNVRGTTYTLHEVEGKQVLFSISGTRGNRRVWRRVK